MSDPRTWRSQARRVRRSPDACAFAALIEGRCKSYDYGQVVITPRAVVEASEVPHQHLCSLESLSHRKAWIAPDFIKLTHNVLDPDVDSSREPLAPLAQLSSHFGVPKEPRALARRAARRVPSGSCCLGRVRLFEVTLHEDSLPIVHVDQAIEAVRHIDHRRSLRPHTTRCAQASARTDTKYRL